MSGYDDAEELMAKQESAIEEVKRLLEDKNLPIDNSEMIKMLELTDYDPDKAFELLAPPLELKTPISDRKISDRVNPLKNRTQKSSQSNNRSTASTQSNKSKTRKNRIAEAQTYEEKPDLESKLPEYLDGAELDIIERDGHCFFRSITHQLRDYGFIVPDEYQTVRNLIADYIDSEILEDIIKAESPTYTTIKDYTDAIRTQLWGGALEIRAVHDGCLNSLTDGQAFKIIVYTVIDNEIKLHPDFLHTMPNGEEEGLIERWPIRLIYVGNNHFHRIYFDDLYKQKQDYVGETVNNGIAESHTSMLSPRIEMSPSEMEAQIRAYEQFNKGRKIVEIDEYSDEYLGLLVDNLSKPFMVMGYQNGAPNILYKTKLVRGSSGYGIKRFVAFIYIPEDSDKDNRQFTRYPNPTMLNVDDKTIVNISLHKWANIWDDDNNIPLGDEGKKKLLIHMTDTNGIEEVIGTKDADFTSISVKEKLVPYERHGERGMSFSPDTGVIALDDSNKNPSCIIHVTDPNDNRKLIFGLNFFRDLDDYNNLYIHSEHNKSGGKSRGRRNTRKQRRNKRRQTKRRPASRAFKLT